MNLETSIAVSLPGDDVEHEAPSIGVGDAFGILFLGGGHEEPLDELELDERQVEDGYDGEHHHHYARWTVGRPRSISLTQAALRGDRWAMRRFTRMLRQRRGRGLDSRRTVRARTRGPGVRRSTSRTVRRAGVRRPARTASRAADGPPGPLPAAVAGFTAAEVGGAAARVTQEQPVEHLRAAASAGEAS
jgi:hypothetical protein